MSLAEMQACLARLYVDETFRRLCHVDPAVLGEYRLDEAEASAIHGIDRAQLESYADSLKAKRRVRIERAYPMLFALSRPQILAYYHRYYQLHVARTDLSPQQDVLGFGRFVEESVDGADHVPACTGDVARYERLYCEARFASDAVTGRDAPVPARSQGLRDTDVLHRSDGVELAAFAFDMAEIEERLLAEPAKPLDGLARAATSIVFRPATRRSDLKLLRINPATEALIRGCDGRRTVHDLAVSFGAVSFGAGPAGGELTAQVVAGLEHLLTLEVLTRDPARAAPARTTQRGYGLSLGEGL